MSVRAHRSPLIWTTSTPSRWAAAWRIPLMSPLGVLCSSQIMAGRRLELSHLSQRASSATGCTATTSIVSSPSSTGVIFTAKPGHSQVPARPRPKARASRKDRQPVAVGTLDERRRPTAMHVPDQAGHRCLEEAACRPASHIDVPRHSAHSTPPRHAHSSSWSSAAAASDVRNRTGTSNNRISCCATQTSWP